MGITGVVASYHTTYGGIANRLHNVALVANLIDGTLIAPGKTFSFNATTGERTPEKGFLEAPVIINGELQTGLGGGVCQVSTTVFNAAYEAGLPIDERVNHALYISHYPLGRDATVNYPDQDLKFTNDTGKWLLLRTFVGVGLVDRQPLRHAAEPSGRVGRAAAPGGRAAADQAHPRSDDAEGESGRGGVRRAGAGDLRDPNRPLPVGSRAAREHVVLDLPLRAEGRPGRDEAEAEAQAEAEADAHRDDDDHAPTAASAPARRAAADYASALATASTNHAGTRVGRCVSASTVACAV